LALTGEIMNINTIRAILGKADPLYNQNYQERLVALDMARKAMIKMGFSYATLGYSQSDAERIENQFSVSTLFTNEGDSRKEYKWWNPFSWGNGEESSEKEKYQPFRGWSSRYHSVKANANKSSNQESGKWEYYFESDNQGAVPSWAGYSG
jgi:hypothetical protein